MRPERRVAEHQANIPGVGRSRVKYYDLRYVYDNDNDFVRKSFSLRIMYRLLTVTDEYWRLCNVQLCMGIDRPIYYDTLYGMHYSYVLLREYEHAKRHRK